MTESNELAPLASSVLNRTYAQTSNTNNGVACKDIVATSGDKLAEVRLNIKCLKTQVSVVTPVTQLRSKTSDLNATKPLELETSNVTQRRYTRCRPRLGETQLADTQGGWI